MPKRSKKAELLDYLIKSALIQTICDDSEDEEGKELDEKIDDILAVQSMRYSVNFIPNSVKKFSNWHQDLLPQMDDDRFRQMVRVDRDQFQFILHEIKDDAVFTPRQHPVFVQLFIVLYRLGSSREEASLAKIANLFGIGDGGTVTIMTKRVFSALLKKESTYISWPSEQDRQTLVKQTFHELPYCLGYVDGTEVHFADKPTAEPDAYYSQQQRFGIKAQIVCDWRLKIRHLVVGYPASVHDARIYGNCLLSRYPDRFFSGMEWLAGDGAYKLSSTVITPFKKRDNQPSTEKKFNHEFSKYRARVDHCIGLLKKRFNSLKELRLIISDKASSQYACQWITVCVILHNMIRTFSSCDDVSLPQGYAVKDEQLDEEPEEDFESGAGADKRNALMDLILQVHGCNQSI